MLDIKEIYPEFQKLNKTDNCIVIVLKNESKLAITSPVSYFPTQGGVIQKQSGDEKKSLKSIIIIKMWLP